MESASRKQTYQSDEHLAPIGPTCWGQERVSATSSIALCVFSWKPVRWKLLAVCLGFRWERPVVTCRVIWSFIKICLHYLLGYSSTQTQEAIRKCHPPWNLAGCLHCAMKHQDVHKATGQCCNLPVEVDLSSELCKLGNSVGSEPMIVVRIILRWPASRLLLGSAKFWHLELTKAAIDSFCNLAFLHIGNIWCQNISNLDQKLH